MVHIQRKHYSKTGESMKLIILTNPEGVISTSADYKYNDPAEIAVALAELERLKTVLVAMWHKTI